MGDDLDRDLHLPEDGRLRAVAVVLHPHPSMGGDRHHPLVIALAERLAAAGVAALRLDLKDPDFTSAAEAVTTEVAKLREELAVDQVLLLGYSWGSVVATLAGVDCVAARVLVAPPVAHVEVPVRSEPALVLVPEHDQYAPPAVVEPALAAWPDARVEVVPGTDHFLAGAIGRISERAVGWLTERA